LQQALVASESIMEDPIHANQLFAANRTVLIASKELKSKKARRLLRPC